MVELWHKNEIPSHALDSFCDSDGNVAATLAGLIEKLDYLQLGVTCLWMLLFFPSPNFDKRLRCVGVYGSRSRARHDRRVPPARRRGAPLGIRVSHRPGCASYLARPPSGSNPPAQMHNHHTVTTISGPTRSPRASNLRTSSRLLSRASGTTTNWPGAITSTCSTTTSPTCISPIRRSRRKSRGRRLLDVVWHRWISRRRHKSSLRRKGSARHRNRQSCSFLNRLHATVTRHNGQALLLAEADTGTGAVQNGSCATGQAFL